LGDQQLRVLLDLNTQKYKIHPVNLPPIVDSVCRGTQHAAHIVYKGT
jgi:hypothetical protein